MDEKQIERRVKQKLEFNGVEVKGINVESKNRTLFSKILKLLYGVRFKIKRNK